MWFTALTLALISVVSCEEPLKVSLRVNPPFVIAADETEQGAINNGTGEPVPKFSGFLIDLLHELSLRVPFNYTFMEKTDGRYGFRNQDGNWNGMIGEVMRGDADITLADLTITSHRMSAVDFSHPFMTSGLSMLVKKPPYLLNNETENEAGKVFIVYSVREIRDLPKQSEIKFGAIKGGSTYAFFQNSENPDYKRIGETMASNLIDLPVSSRDAVERVINSNGKYAYIGESAMFNYFAATRCNVVRLGQEAKTVQYGIAVRKGSELKQHLDKAIIELEETGLLNSLRQKWWPQGQCPHGSLKFQKTALEAIIATL